MIEPLGSKGGGVTKVKEGMEGELLEDTKACAKSLMEESTVCEKLLGGQCGCSVDGGRKHI